MRAMTDCQLYTGATQQGRRSQHRDHWESLFRRGGVSLGQVVSDAVQGEDKRRALQRVKGGQGSLAELVHLALAGYELSARWDSRSRVNELRSHAVVDRVLGAMIPRLGVRSTATWLARTIG